ncbi:hypothetical protein JW777_08510 [bacterium]|nr:hypothetical protein [bacterium]
MRKRKWVLVLMLLLLVGYIGGYGVWKLNRTDDKIKGLLLEKVRPFLSEGSDVRRVKIGWGRVYLEGVTLVPRDRSFLLEMEELQVGVSLRNLIRYRLNPGKVAHDVVFVRPILKLKPPEDAAQNGPKGKTWSDYRETVESIGSIQRVTIAGAGIQIQNASGGWTPVATSMDGVLITSPADSAAVRLSGHLFDSKSRNLDISGRLDIWSGRVRRLVLRLDESDPSSNLTSLIPSFSEVRGGHVKCECRYDEQTGLNGFLDYINGDFSLKDSALRFSGVNLHGRFREDGLAVSGIVEGFNGSRLTIQGEIRSILQPECSLLVRCPALDVKRFFSEMGSSSAVPSAESASFTVAVSGAVTNPDIRGTVRATGFREFGTFFRQLRLTVLLSDSVLQMSGSAVNPEGLNLNAEGGIRFDSPDRPSDFRLRLEGDGRGSLPSVAAGRLSALACEAGLRLTGPLSNLHGNLSARLVFRPRSGDPMTVQTDAYYRETAGVLFIRSAEGLRVTGSFNRPFGAESEWDLQAAGLEWFASRFSKSIRPDSVRLDGGAEAKAGRWTASVTGVEKDGPAGRQRFFSQAEGRPKGRGRQQVSVSGRYAGPSGEGLPFGGEFLLSSSETLVQRLNIGDFISAAMRIPGGDSGGSWDGRIQIQNLKLDRLHAAFPRLNPFFGRMNGRLSIRGPEKEPEYNLDLSLREGVFHRVGRLDGDVSAGWGRNGLNAFEVSLNRERIPLLLGSVKPAGGDSLKGEIQSGSLDLAELFQAITGRERMVNGRASVRMRVSGRRETPVISARLETGEGAIRTVGFKKFSVTLEDTLLRDGRFSGGSLSIRDGRVEREDGLAVQFEGTAPHDGPLDLMISGKGPILGFLPETGDFFRKVRSSGEFRLGLAGRPDRPVLKSGWVRLEDADIEFSSVIERIRRLSLEAVTGEGDSLLQIVRCSGEMRGGRFQISNRNPDPSQPGEAPLCFKFLRLNLGVLGLSTRGKGIPLHIPGLMADGEQGWLAFSGYQAGPFLLAGPPESPLLRGVLQVSENQLTYPFLEESGGNANPGLNRLLKSIRWNIRIVPKKDVHYIRDMEGPFGNVYVDLRIQDGTGSFSLEGCIRDGTFQVYGGLVSDEGTIEVLDRYFRPERLTFEYPRGGSPIFTGRASTTVVDSLGIASTVWMNLVSVDEETGIEEKGGPWKKVQFRFSTDNPNLGRSEADLLAAIGYSEGNIRNRAYDAIGIQVENRLFRPFIKPIERGMRRYLGFDMVKFSSMFSRNLLDLQSMETPVFDPRLLLRNSKVMLGKSFTPGFMIVYTGEVQNDLRYVLPQHGIGLRHALALEYIVKPELMLELEYTYDNLLLYERREDKRIWLKHVFPF